MKTHRRDAGFSLAAIVFFATVTSIFIAAAVPVYQMQAKRELEEELLFRGGEYTRAIQKYRAKFGTYPTSIDQLVSTNGLRFLRRAYKDPLTGKDFRLLTINPDGSLNGSKIFQQNMPTQSMFGNTTPATNSTSGPQAFGSTSPTQTPVTQTQTSQQPGGFGVGGGVSSTGGGFGPQPGALQNPQQPQQPQQTQQAQPGFPSTGSSSSPFGGASNPLGTSSGGFASGGFGGQPVTSGGIVGVASDSDKPSIKIYNNRQKYNEWEFVALINQQGQAGPGGIRPGTQTQNPLGTGTQTQSPFTGTQTQNPFGTGTQTQNPFTGTQTQNPLGTGAGMPPQNPFGTPTIPTNSGTK